MIIMQPIRRKIEAKLQINYQKVCSNNADFSLLAYIQSIVA